MSESSNSTFSVCCWFVLSQEIQCIAVDKYDIVSKMELEHCLPLDSPLAPVHILPLIKVQRPTMWDPWSMIQLKYIHLQSDFSGFLEYMLNRYKLLCIIHEK